jgi:exopolyphosphatase/guanosine-5'-triphosphate,3'-diphosphate pyrophosphatase
MDSARRAVIDVGTNSIKLLVAEVAGRDVHPVWEESKQTRLGHGFYDTHRLQPGPMSKTGQAVADFIAKARDQRVGSIRVIATSAVRDAVNAAELTGIIEEACGVKVEIISGDQEAELIFRGVTADPELRHGLLLILEVGGGSSEMILGHGDHLDFRRSFPLGTVRLLATLPDSDPPKQEELRGCRRWVREFLQKEIMPELAVAPQGPPDRQSIHGDMQLVGTGGTASILGCLEAGLATFDRARLEATRITRERLSWHVNRLWSLPLEERKQLVGLPPNRADVILAGAVIYEAVLEQLGFDILRISTRGLRFGAVLG